MLIGFIGAPCCGKSTTAFGLCNALKKQGYAVEFFAEYARRHIIETRIKGGFGNGGLEGQKKIYACDTENAAFYRTHSDAISITDGGTVNCYFYGLDTLDIATEAAKYDMLFYVSITDVPPTQCDSTRVQNRDESMAMAIQWDNVIRPLLGVIPNITEIKGYPLQNPDAMVEQAMSEIQNYIRVDKRLAA